jgi:xylan 1,4-beta-xylosidase
MIRNPILKGFNPDPSIVRVGDEYYIATSTFEWYPGVQIHHSRDLVNWRLLTRPLRTARQLDMLGDPTRAVSGRRASRSAMDSSG